LSAELDPLKRLHDNGDRRRVREQNNCPREKEKILQVWKAYWLKCQLRVFCSLISSSAVANMQANVRIHEKIEKRRIEVIVFSRTRIASNWLDRTIDMKPVRDGQALQCDAATRRRLRRLPEIAGRFQVFFSGCDEFILVDFEQRGVYLTMERS
jgi:hypothetical protein